MLLVFDNTNLSIKDYYLLKVIFLLFFLYFTSRLEDAPICESPFLINAASEHILYFTVVT